MARAWWLGPSGECPRRRWGSGAESGLGYGLVTIGNGVALTQADEVTPLFDRIRK